MKRKVVMRTAASMVAVAAIAVTMPVFADKPAWAGAGKGGKADRQNDGARHDGRKHAGFEERQREAARAYYGERVRAGHCPPGLAKKNNGCLPPGQAKKWRVGAPLPRDVVFHPVPAEIVVRIGVPPAGYRFVRIANDILMIAVGTGMVIDAIEDLGRL